ncbi:hypothetical protein EDB85DRAFT_2160691 [Lactarius pseudohatsudake]|nr:hypothetical protein EDB85DRAFT_2160691 [Lactarius pseudohatsudake]
MGLDIRGGVYEIRRKLLRHRQSGGGAHASLRIRGGTRHHLHPMLRLVGADSDIRPEIEGSTRSCVTFQLLPLVLLQCSQDTLIILAWTPVDFTLERQTTARELAAEACLRDPPSGLRRVQSAAKQKDSARKEAVEDWAQDWRKKRREREAGGNPRSFAHKHTITQPPDGGAHALWQAATQKAKNSEGNKTRRFRFSRRTTSTAIQVAVDHAFTGTYVDRFRPNDPPEARECPCGHRTRSSLHIIHSCTRFNAARLQAHIPLIPNNPTRFSRVIGPGRKDAEHLLNFIQESHVLTHPEAGPREEVPPEPD